MVSGKLRNGLLEKLRGGGGYFLGLIGEHEFFSFNFLLREYFFLDFARSPPHKFSNGPSLRIYRGIS